MPWCRSHYITYFHNCTNDLTSRFLTVNLTLKKKKRPRSMKVVHIQEPDGIYHLCKYVITIYRRQSFMQLSIIYCILRFISRHPNFTLLNVLIWKNICCRHLNQRSIFSQNKNTTKIFSRVATSARMPPNPH